MRAHILAKLLAFSLLLENPFLSSTSSSFAAESLGANEQLVTIVNAERAAAGLGQLRQDDALAASAGHYAAYMASTSFFGHTAPDGSTPQMRAAGAGYTYTWLAENLAAGEASPAKVVAAWLESDEHRARMLSPNPADIGVGYATGGRYGYYWVLVLGARPASAPDVQLAGDWLSQLRTNTVEAAPNDPYRSAGRCGLLASALAAPIAGLSSSWTSEATGFTVAGEWLEAFQRLGGLDTLGEPISEVARDTAVPDQIVQYFQRTVLEFHPENQPPYRIQRRLLGDLLYPLSDSAVEGGDAPPGPYAYFPLSQGTPVGLGHFVADYTRTGEATYFKEYFETHGGIDTFGFPKEEPKLRDGIWRQRFQAATLEYHPENDRDGVIPCTQVAYRNYRVQLALLGETYAGQIGGVPKAPCAAR